MTFVSTFYKDFRSLSNGPISDPLFNINGATGSISGGLFRSAVAAAYLDNFTYISGTSPNPDSKIILLLPAGFNNGDCIVVGLRTLSYNLPGDANPYPGQYGCLYLRLMRAAYFNGGNVVQVNAGPCRISTRSPNFAVGINGASFTCDSAKAHWVEVSATGTTSIAHTIKVYEDTGADTSAGDCSVAFGTLIYNATGTYDATNVDISYLQQAGPPLLANDDISGGDLYPSNPSKVAAIQTLTQSSTTAPALSAPAPTVTNRTATVSTLTAAPTGGTAPLSVAWYSAVGDSEFAPGSGNLISSSQYSNGGLTLSHTHGDAAGTLRFYRYIVTDSAGTPASVTSSAIMVEALRPALGALPTLRPDLLAGRKLIYAGWGDSITNAAEILSRVPPILAANGINNVVIVNGGVPGIALSEPNGWLPDALAYNGVFAFEAFCTQIETAVAANPGAMLVISGMILTNDSQRYNVNVDMTDSVIRDDFETVFGAFETRFPGSYQIINCQPYRWNAPISAPARTAEIRWRQATLDAVAAAQADGVNVVVGDRRFYAEVYRHPEYLGDQIHPNGGGGAAGAVLHADALMRNVLFDPGTVQNPVFSPAAGAVATGTVVTVSSVTPNSTTHHTLDGSTPTIDSPTGPFTVTGALTAKAISLADGKVDSAVVTAAYTIATTPPPADTTPPTAIFSALGIDGITGTITFNEATEGDTGLSIRVGGVTRPATFTRIDSTHIGYVLTSEAFTGQSVTGYYNPANGDIADLAGNELGAIAARAITNGSEQSAPPVETGVGLALVRGVISLAGRDGYELDRQTFIAGDAEPDMMVQFRDGINSPIDLTGCTVTMDLFRVGADTFIVEDGECVIEAASLGFARYSWGPNDLAAAGTYRARFYRTSGGGRASTGPITIIVKDRLSN